MSNGRSACRPSPSRVRARSAAAPRLSREASGPALGAHGWLGSPARLPPAPTPRARLHGGRRHGARSRARTKARTPSRRFAELLPARTTATVTPAAALARPIAAAAPAARRAPRLRGALAVTAAASHRREVSIGRARERSPQASGSGAGGSPAASLSLRRAHPSKRALKLTGALPLGRPQLNAHLDGMTLDRLLALALTPGAPEPDERPAPDRRRHAACESARPRARCPPAPRRASPAGIAAHEGPGTRLASRPRPVARLAPGPRRATPFSAPRSRPWRLLGGRTPRGRAAPVRG